MFIVTGASGQLGRRIVERLLDHVPAEQIGISARDPSKVDMLARRGVRVLRGDYDDADSLRSAWEGGTRLLLVSSNGAAQGRDPVAQHATAISVAAKLGVERILYTSQMSSSPASLFPPGRDHAATEALLAASGISWTAMRHGFYAESALTMHGDGLRAGIITAPADGPVAWTSHDDLAAADALLLAGARTINGPTPPLTGDATSDLADLAVIASGILGKQISRKLIGLDELATSARSRGMPDGAAKVMQGYYLASAAGEFGATDPLLATMIGRHRQAFAKYWVERLRE